MMLILKLRHFNSQMHYFRTFLPTIIEVTLTFKFETVLFFPLTYCHAILTVLTLMFTLTQLIAHMTALSKPNTIMYQ